MVQILEAPVPQMVEQLPDEQVIEVPKILPEDVPMRASVRDSQLAEQLVEVPTIISFSSLQRVPASVSSWTRAAHEDLTHEHATVDDEDERGHFHGLRRHPCRQTKGTHSTGRIKNQQNQPCTCQCP